MGRSSRVLVVGTWSADWSIYGQKSRASLCKYFNPVSKAANQSGVLKTIARLSSQLTKALSTRAVFGAPAPPRQVLVLETLFLQLTVTLNLLRPGMLANRPRMAAHLMVPLPHL